MRLAYLCKILGGVREMLDTGPQSHHTCTLCSEPATLSHCTRDCAELADADRLSLHTLFKCDREDPETVQASRLEFRKLLRTAKRQLVELDTSTITEGDTLTVLWKGGHTKAYIVLGRGHTRTHHRVYDPDEMRMKVLNTQSLADERRILCTHNERGE